MMHGIVFEYSLLEKHTVNSNVSVILRHIRPFMLTIVYIASQRLMKFSDKIFTRFTVLWTSQLYKNNINYHNYNLYVCGKPY